MPIRADLRHYYRTPEAKAAKLAVMERAKNRCEWCGKPNGRVVTVLRGASAGWWFDDEDSLWKDSLGRRAASLPPEKRGRRARIVVRIGPAHLDHDPSNHALNNQAALCQRCHLLYDGKHHYTTARLRRDAETGQLRLELLSGST